MNNKPTLGPWEVVRVAQPLGAPRFFVRNNENAEDYFELCEAMTAADAALIVEAVNMHDALVSSAKNYLDLLEALIAEGTSYVDGRHLKFRREEIVKVLMEIKE